MSLGAKLAIVAVAAALTVGLYFVLRPDDNSNRVTSTTPTVTAGTVSLDADGKTIDIVVKDGKPVGGIATPKVTEGDQVQLTVTSDVSDEVHVHGYDISIEAGDNAPATLVFDADTVGRFEIELEESKELLAELSVEPR